MADNWTKTDYIRGLPPEFRVLASSLTMAQIALLDASIDRYTTRLTRQVEDTTTRSPRGEGG